MIIQILFRNRDYIKNFVHNFTLVFQKYLYPILYFCYFFDNNERK